jgi:hypothetical protein
MFLAIGIEPVVGGNSEWTYETAFILSSFELRDYATEALQAECGGRLREFVGYLVRPQGFEPEPTDYETC